MRLRHDYLRSTPDERECARSIVRAGEALVTLEGVEELDQAGAELTDIIAELGLEFGEGVRFDEARLQWVAEVPEVGYLVVTPDELHVVPLVTISADADAAYLELRSPTADEEPITREDIDRAVQASGVRAGFAERRIDAAWNLFQSSGSLPGPIPIARGTPPLPGRAAGIEYSIVVGPSAASLACTDDEIDYREHHWITNVRVGQELGYWYPASPSRPGRRVDGTVIEVASHGEDRALDVGANIVTTELPDGRLRLTAAIDGMVVFDTEGVPSVTDTLELAGDVTIETGNLDAHGSIIVSGNIDPGIIVRATADIIVRGTVEGATLRAGGTITVEKILMGAPGQVVAAGGDIFLSNVQNATVEAGGDVHLRGSDTASSMTCSGDLLAHEGTGNLRGGRYRAGGSIKARVLGSELGAPTSVSAGHDALRERARLRLLGAIKALQAEERKVARDPSLTLGSRTKSRRQLERQRAALYAALQDLAATTPAREAASVVALQRVYYGVSVEVERHVHEVESSSGGRRFVLNMESNTVEEHAP